MVLIFGCRLVVVFLDEIQPKIKEVFSFWFTATMKCLKTYQPAL